MTEHERRAVETLQQELKYGPRRPLRYHDSNCLHDLLDIVTRAGFVLATPE
jgi:hypothetical protein